MCISHLSHGVSETHSQRGTRPGAGLVSKPACYPLCYRSTTVMNTLAVYYFDIFLACIHAWFTIRTCKLISPSLQIFSPLIHLKCQFHLTRCQCRRITWKKKTQDGLEKLILIWIWIVLRPQLTFAHHYFSSFIPYYFPTLLDTDTFSRE